MDTAVLSLMTFPMASDILQRKMTPKDTLALAGQAGIPCVDLMSIPNFRLAQYKNAMQSTGVRVFCYIMQTSFFLPRRVWQYAVRSGLKTAASLGAKYLMIVPYQFIDRAKAERMGRREVVQKMIEGFHYAVKQAAGTTVNVCFETTPHDVSGLCATDECLAVLQAVPNLHFVFDTANMLPHGEEPLAAYERLKPYISYVHLKDVALEPASSHSGYAEITADGQRMRAVPWGQGVIPLQELYTKMRGNEHIERFAVEYAHPAGGACGFADHQKQLAAFLRALQDE